MSETQANTRCRRFQDLTGMVFGMLTVVEFSKAKASAYWKCKCECGGATVVRSDHLKSGATVSCGCKIGRTVKHGHAADRRPTPEYRTWAGIISRCTNSSEQSFKYYGGRGITVCDRWRNSFEAFLEDMGERPSPTHSIDRINVDGNYEPGNCRWATLSEQATNKRNSRRVTINGETRLLSEWAEYFNIPYSTVRKRIRISGLSVEEALTAPSLRGRMGSKKPVPPPKETPDERDRRRAQTSPPPPPPKH